MSLTAKLAEDVVWQLALEASSLGLLSQSLSLDRLRFYLNEQGEINAQGFAVAFAGSSVEQSLRTLCTPGQCSAAMCGQNMSVTTDKSAKVYTLNMTMRSRQPRLRPAELVGVDSLSAFVAKGSSFVEHCNATPLASRSSSLDVAISRTVRPASHRSGGTQV